MRPKSSPWPGGVLHRGIAVSCHKQETQLCVGVGHKETWDVPVALQVCPLGLITP